MPTGKEIAEFIEEASLVANNPAILPGVTAEEATQVRRIAQITVAMADRITELERAAETSRAEHAAALGLAIARIRELEGERDELLGLLNDERPAWCGYVEPEKCPGDWGPDDDSKIADVCWEHRRRAIVARIEKATKGTR